MSYTVWMYSKVKRLRVRGARRSDHEIAADPGTVGHITTLTVGSVLEMKIHAAGDDSRRVPMIPSLFNPELHAMLGPRMLVAGLERQGDQSDAGGATYMQEWAIEVMQPVPADHAESSHRPVA